MRPRVLGLCSPWHIATVFRPQAWAELRDTCIVINACSDAEADSLLASCDAALTGWGTSFPFTAERINSSPRLRLIVHTAGSVKHLLPDPDGRAEMLRRGAAVYAGGSGMAVNVAESTLGYLILALRRWPELAKAYPDKRRAGIALPGDTPPRTGQFLTGATVGLVALSTIARLTLPLLEPFGCRILAYDPYVSKDEAQRLNVELTTLDDLFARSDAVSVHVPALPETHHLIGARQLGLMRDGAALVNTARGNVIDHSALLDECRTGRISAALDVTDPEPLPEDSPFWTLPNVFITPHIAAQGFAGLFQIGDGALDAVRALANGSLPRAGVVPLERWNCIA